MKVEKKSFILYIDTLDISDHLSDKKLGKFFRAIINFQKNKEYELLDTPEQADPLTGRLESL